MSPKKDKIINEAESVFLLNSYNEVKMSQIADMLNLKKPSLYHHFPSGKEELYTATILYSLSKYKIKLNEILECDDMFDVTLRNLIELISKDETLAFNIMMKIDMPQISKSNRDIITQTIIKDIFDPITNFFQKAQNQNIIREFETSYLSGILLAIGEGMKNVPLPMIKNDLYNKVVDIFLYGIKEVVK